MATLTQENLSAIGAVAGEAMASAAKDWDTCSSAANEALGNVNMKDTSELAAYRTPPKAVCDVLFAAMICLGYPDSELTWAKAKKMLGRTSSLIEQMLTLLRCPNGKSLSYDPKTIDQTMIKRLKPYMKLEALDPEVAGAVSKAVKTVAMWVQAVNYYGS